MGYYLRVLSLNESAPTLEEICDFLLNNKIKFSINYGKNSQELNNRKWKQILFQYNPKKNPIILDRDVIPEQKDIVKDEINEFLDEINELGFSLSKTKITKMLQKTKQIFALQIPTTDITGDRWYGWKLTDAIVNFLVEKTNGFVQADGEGFYLKNKLVLKVK